MSSPSDEQAKLRKRAKAWTPEVDDNAAALRCAALLHAELRLGFVESFGYFVRMKRKG